MKKIIFALVVLFICTVSNVYAADIWDGTSDTSWYDDTQTTFYLMTAEQLAGLAELVNGGNNFDGKNIILGDDINLNNHTWTSIGDSNTHIFAGNFDGNNHTISGLTDGNGTGSAIDTGTYGLLGYVANPNAPVVIKNINLTNVNIKQTTSGKGVGALISYAHESGVGFTIKNVNVSGYIEGIYHVGGVVGKTYSGGEILFEDVENTATIVNKGYGMTGGIIGIFSHTGSTSKPNVTLKNVKNKGSVTNNTTNTTYGYTNAMQVSGIIGNVNSAKTIKLENCENIGKISSPGLRQMSGIANIDNAETLIFKNNINKGDLYVTNFNNYNTNISTSSLNHLGGLFAQVNVTNKISIEGTNTNYGTIGTLDNNKIYSGSYAGGIFGSINWSQNSITIEFKEKAKLVNEGTVYSRQYAGGIAGIYKAISNINSGILENYGDIITIYTGNNETSASGGIFGTMNNLNTTSLTNKFKVVVENSEISASGFGEKIHTATDNFVAAGGYIGINHAYNIDNSNIYVRNTSVTVNSANQDYQQAYAGGIYGLVKLTSDNAVISSLNNLMVNKSKIKGKYAGEIVGAAYDSYYSSGRNVLNVTGNGLIKTNQVDSSNNAFDRYLGVKINQAYITIDITEKYTVSFETNGGTEKEDITVDVFTKVKEPQDIEKEGYILKGWYLDENFEKKYDFNNIVSKNLVLFAKWEEEPENETEKPDTDDIEKPDTDFTEKPDTGDTEKPDTGDTEKPDTEDTEIPDIEDTEKPNIEDTEKPNVDNIKNPVTSDNIPIYILMFSISLIGLVSLILIKKKN